MRIKGIVLGCIIASSVSAGGMGPVEANNYRIVLGLLGGYAGMSAGSAQTWTANENNFIYTANDNGGDNGFVGGFFGAETGFFHPGMIVQLGIEYDAFGTISVQGQHFVGADDLTYTPYEYRYTFQTQQLLGAAKLLATMYDRFHPYAAVGLGAAFNNASDFRAFTHQPDPLNIAPVYFDTNSTSFSYTLGLGVEGDFNDHFRWGLGYRYSNFGTVGFGNGTVRFNNYVANTPFNFSTSNAYANQFLAQITYLA